MIKGSALKGALAAAPRGGRVTSLPVGPNPATQAVNAAIQGAQGVGLQRVSPGVYRNQQGNLVNSKGGSLPGQQPQRPQQMPNRFNDISSMLGGASGQQMQNPYLRFDQQQQPPHWKMPAPNQFGQNHMMYMGGSPNFNEMTGQYDHQMTGQYDQNLAAITQASQAAQQQQRAGGFNMGGGFAPKQYLQQQLTPQQQAFNQQQAAGNSMIRIMPNGQIAE